MKFFLPGYENELEAEAEYQRIAADYHYSVPARRIFRIEKIYERERITIEVGQFSPACYGGLHIWAIFNDPVLGYVALAPGRGVALQVGAKDGGPISIGREAEAIEYFEEP